MKPDKGNTEDKGGMSPDAIGKEIVADLLDLDTDSFFDSLSEEYYQDSIQERIYDT